MTIIVPNCQEYFGPCPVPPPLEEEYSIDYILIQSYDIDIGNSYSAARTERIISGGGIVNHGSPLVGASVSFVPNERTWMNDDSEHLDTDEYYVPCGYEMEFGIYQMARAYQGSRFFARTRWEYLPIEPSTGDPYEAYCQSTLITADLNQSDSRSYDFYLDDCSTCVCLASP